MRELTAEERTVHAVLGCYYCKGGRPNHINEAGETEPAGDYEEMDVAHYFCKSCGDASWIYTWKIRTSTRKCLSCNEEVEWVR